MIHCIRTVALEEGPLALWSGLGAGIQRQYAFASLRLGMFDPVKDYLSNGKETTLGIRIGTGLITGTIAMLIASPTDLVKIRL
jgi:solute carrier family 25 (mitochondrial uncoupling protein), member 8/9